VIHTHSVDRANNVLDRTRLATRALTYFVSGDTKPNSQVLSVSMYGFGKVYV